MKDIIVRKANVKDFTQLIELFLSFYTYIRKIDPSFRLAKNPKEISQKYLRRFIYPKNRNLIVAEKNGELIGFMSLAVTKNSSLFMSQKSGIILEAYVIEKMRKMGVNHLITRMAYSWFKENNVKKVELFVLPGNEIGRKVWEKEGFQDVLLKKRRFI